MDGEISTDAVRDALADEGGDPVVVDVRQPGTYRRGHIPGSHNVPFQELPERIPTLFGAGDAVDDDDGTGGDADSDGEAPSDADPADTDHVVTVCPHAEASRQAAHLIAAFEGVDATVESMAGGLRGWDGDLVRGAADIDGDGGDDGVDADADAPF